MHVHHTSTIRPIKILLAAAAFILFFIVSQQAWAKICSQDTWCGENPLPQGNHLNGVWADSGIDIFAVGEAGTILHYNGNNWTDMDSGTTQSLHGVWGNRGSDVFVVGEDGIILRRTLKDDFPWVLFLPRNST